MGEQGGKQVWQDEHCDSGRPEVHCKTASLQGKQYDRALKHSLHCLNEEHAPRASRQGEGMASFRAQSQAEVMGQWFYHLVACTRPLEFFLIVFGTWSILRRRQTHTWKHRCHWERQHVAGVRQKTLETWHFIRLPSLRFIWTTGSDFGINSVW